MKKVSKALDITLEELLEAGCHFGHQVKRWNPKMAPYIYGDKDGVHIFDLAKTREGLLEAYEAVKKTVSEGGIVLFVGTKRQAKEIAEEAAKKVGMPYLTTRWLGGALTNFEQIKKSIKKLSDLKEGLKTGKYDGYTKRERLLMDREIASLERVFGGIVDMGKLPDMIFLASVHEEATAVREAVRMKVPVVGITDTNADPKPIDYPIPANDDAVKSVSLIVDVIVKAVEDGKSSNKSN